MSIHPVLPTRGKLWSNVQSSQLQGKKLGEKRGFSKVSYDKNWRERSSFTQEMKEKKTNDSACFSQKRIRDWSSDKTNQDQRIQATSRIQVRASFPW